MSEHGDYDEKNLRWFCTRWIDEKKWLEIHGYPPISTSIESDERGTADNESDEHGAVEST